jgi:hypothetical protein
MNIPIPVLRKHFLNPDTVGDTLEVFNVRVADLKETDAGQLEVSMFQILGKMASVGLMDSAEYDSYLSSHANGKKPTPEFIACCQTVLELCIRES